MMLTPNRANRESQKNLPKRAMSGRSMRQQAFMAFDLGMRPTNVAAIIDLSRITAFRYFEQWRKLPPFLEMKCKLARRCFRKLDHKDRRKIAQIWHRSSVPQKKKFSAQMKKPWAIKQIVTGEWRQWRVSSTRAQPKTVLCKGVRILVSPRYFKEVKYIVEMAMNQNINPFED